MKSNEKVNIVKDSAQPESDEIIAKAIIELADGTKRLLNGRLSRRAILLLLKDPTGISMEKIDKIILAIPRLREFTK
jgi:hypothetical protein